MSRRRSKKKKNNGTINKSSLDLTSIEEQIQRLNVQKNLMLEEGLLSDNVADIIKANNYLEKVKSSVPDPRSYMWLPDNWFHTGQGYKESLKGISFDVLQRMGNTFISKAIVNTRVEQIQRFLKFTTDESREGYTIKRKRTVFAKPESVAEYSYRDQKQIEYLIEFLEFGGENSKWDATDDLSDFIRKITRDSLILDQLTFECTRDRLGNLKKYKAIDASTIRILDCADPRYHKEWEKWQVNGHYPQFAQVWNNQILKNPISKEPIIFYPWELGYGVRNKTSNIRTNGYGVSEQEVLIDIVTWTLWGMQYNGNFFKQGSQPKGFINIKSPGMNNTTLNEFRNNWRQMMSSVRNAHRIPVFEGIDLEWVDMQLSNRDMEFHGWVEFLLIITCSVYTIDPTELGFNFKQAQQLFSRGGQKERLQHSKKKGLAPLLKFLEKIINKYIISEVDPRFEFLFTGVDTEDREMAAKVAKLELDAGIVSFEYAFEKRMGRPFDPEKDTILNPQMVAMEQIKTFGGAKMNGIVDGMEEGQEDFDPNVEAEPNVFDQFGKASEEDPIIKASLEYINQTLGV